MLKLIDIKKNYPIGDQTVSALKGVDIEFRSNEFVSVLGPSGCGKTTLLNIIGGLDQYSSGDLIINGKSTKDFKAADWDAYRNHRIGFVFQSYNLIPHLTVLGNVELALTISGVSAEERKSRAKAALEKVGLSEHLGKHPNQLSGGQMQRVAIARAIVNNPEILLADEPTGALDTTTSVQIMDIIKEIAKERLVIMVTHNPELASKYSSRIIKLLDGSITDDSNPYRSADKEQITQSAEKEKTPPTADTDGKSAGGVRGKAQSKTVREKTSMSFLTALSLSFRNLLTKKVRTVITAIAGSIGIIGIALVLSISNGFNNYIQKMQADTLSSYPLTITTSATDYTALMTSMMGGNHNNGTKFPTDDKIYVNNILEEMKKASIKNTITPEYIDYIQNPANIDPNLYYDIKLGYGLTLENYFFASRTATKEELEEYFGTLPPNIPIPDEIAIRYSINAGGNAGSIIQEMSTNTDFINMQYDVLKGKLPTEKNEILLVVDEYNRLTDLTLSLLGLKTEGDNVTEYDFDEIMKTKFYIYTNQQIYTKNSSGLFSQNTVLPDIGTDTSALELKITGIVRINDKTSIGSLSTGIAYTQALTNYVLEQNRTSDVVSWMKANVGKSPLTGTVFDPQDDKKNTEAYDQLFYSVGGSETATEISIYAKDFNAKESIKKALDAYNTGKDDQSKIIYSDVMAVMVSSLTTMVNAISYVLVAFTAISLVVSGVMIGIITYVSVVERTKEIGVLRSIGARKKDISRVFNAETFLIGLTSGLIGVIVAIILNFPINLIINALVEGVGNIASLNIIHALILVAISILLTLISGFIPSKIAAKKDPVIALRTE